MKTGTMILLAVGAAAFLVGAPIACTYMTTATSVATAPGRVANRTLGTDNIIQNYEWFKQQVADVGAMDTRLAAQQAALARFEQSAGPRTGWTFEDKTEHSRLTAIVAGLEGQRASMVAEYNARSTMANRRLFKDRGLPETLT